MQRSCARRRLDGKRSHAACVLGIKAYVESGSSSGIIVPVRAFYRRGMPRGPVASCAGRRSGSRLQ
eukprot:3039364-Prymnesium_polylepis.2